MWLELWKSVDAGHDYEVTRSQKEVEPGYYELVKIRDALFGDTTYVESICLKEGEYRFTSFDVWDGICCIFGDGHYNVTTSYGVFIAEGGMFSEIFSRNESTTFTMPFVKAPSSIPSISRSSASSSSPSTLQSHHFHWVIVVCQHETLTELSVIYNQYNAEVFVVMGAVVDL